MGDIVWVPYSDIRDLDGSMKVGIVQRIPKRDKCNQFVYNCFGFRVDFVVFIDNFEIQFCR